MIYLSFSLIVITGIVCATALFLDGQPWAAILIILVTGTISFKEKSEK